MTEREAREWIRNWHGKHWPWQREEMLRFERCGIEYAIAFGKINCNVKALIAALVRCKIKSRPHDDGFNWLTGRMLRKVETNQTVTDEDTFYLRLDE